MRIWMLVAAVSWLTSATSAFVAHGSTKTNRKFLYSNQLLLNDDHRRHHDEVRTSVNAAAAAESRINNSKVLELAVTAAASSSSSTRRNANTIKVYRLDDILAAKLQNSGGKGSERHELSDSVKPASKPKDRSKLLIRFRNRFGAATATGAPRFQQSTNLLTTLAEATSNDDAHLIDKQVLASNFLSKTTYLLSKLEKEAELVESEFKPYGKKYFHLLRSKLKSAFDNMRQDLCEAIDRDEDGNYYAATAAATDERAKQRRRARFSDVRVFKKICNKK